MQGVRGHRSARSADDLAVTDLERLGGAIRDIGRPIATLEQRAQLEGVVWGSPLGIVVKVDVDVEVLGQPAADTIRPVSRAR